MHSFTMSQHVAAPIDVVFDVATDLQRAAERIRGIDKIEVLTPGPVGGGTRWRETRRMMGREATEMMEFTAFDPPHQYTVGCNACGAAVETTFRFQPADAADKPETQLTVEIRCEARSLFAKILSPLTKRMFEKMMRACMEGDLTDLKRAAEAMATSAVKADPTPSQAGSV